MASREEMADKPWRSVRDFLEWQEDLSTYGVSYCAVVNGKFEHVPAVAWARMAAEDRELDDYGRSG